MRRVRFGARERAEMAIAWGGPAALVMAVGALVVRPAWAVPLAGLALALGFGVFFGYDRLPGPRRLWVIGAGVLAAAGGAWLAGSGAGGITAAAACGASLAAILTADYAGSTPIAGGSHFEERHWHVTLDASLCEGVFSCWEVCPEACFEKRKDVRKVVIANGERCIRCGACVVQCPEDALAFEDGAGRRIEPDVIRRFKLNLVGRRAIDSGAANVTPGSARE